ncbi:PKD domain-containing protein [Methanosarcina hadiensis]|uniref:PKD domain-containing protein n=1 Tax=Methanosarcina hadiensis TaxID=3078083 RepID=UPI0039774850
MVSSTGTASELYVKEGESIQSKVNEAVPGDIILVDQGKFNESIFVNKENLTIKSASGNPDNTIIMGESGESYVFEITASGVNVSGFSITDGRYGIFLNNIEGCTISSNKISNQEVGIYLFGSGNNLLTNNMVYSNSGCGIKLLASPDNVICGNYFNNIVNVRDNKLNTWNDSVRGNYWSDYEGLDENEDGIGDTPYAVNPEAGSMDYRPLTDYLSTSAVLPSVHFTSDVTEGFAPLSVRFKDFSENATSRLWDFGDGNKSSDSSPLHTYFSEGNYNVTLTVDNENSSVSASVTISVLNASEQPDPLLPEAEFIYNTTNGSVPLVIKFVDLSRNADCVSWAFGDGKKSCCPEPAHTFCCPGNYTVSLTAINENGTSSKCIVVTVLKNESYTGEEENRDTESASGTENTDGLISYVTRYATGISDEFFGGDNATGSEVTENPDSGSGNKSESKGSSIIDKEELKSIKDSVVSTTSSKVLTETGKSLENETLKTQKNIESLVGDSIPEATDNSLPEIKKRIAPWAPSFLGLAGVIFVFSILKIGRRARK